MKIFALVDFMGCMDMTPEEEYCYIREWFEDALETKFIFKSDKYPHDLENEKVDIYVIDFGGLLPGCDSAIASVYRELLTQIGEKPNTLFILWSQFTFDWYKDMMTEVAPDLEGFNVIKKGAKDFVERLKDWVR